ncbi:hypothetical protein [Sulfuracidifex metallicus]|uniref:CHAD domain-containing protein n=1 Tax=Sulfuracidifex metallicus DSM 6482 = JCM 9184 TaxID=523847 RepID=A0A6A9QP10_SULME|nr:hypothetical protein [Sulfuracidifex metallicus]MUN30050.1 hypothetical protein [Sulfuracidifex metallicus DSM 6482 = JCM 9184]WOE51569.1 hypothetical protein RQ359_000880 [Sulfuracidifex metallicus DSM 6482 = JCM 9184]
MRPERYANVHLKKAMESNGVHRRRVEVRKYLVISRVLVRLTGEKGCVKRAKKEVKSLGKLRDLEVASCIPLPHYELGDLDMKDCMMRKVFGSRLLVAERVFLLYHELNKEMKLHPLRKTIREALFLLESLGIVDERLKALAKELGRLRDQQLMAQLCEGKEIDFDVDELRLKAKDFIRELLSITEFDHIKCKLHDRNNI